MAPLRASSSPVSASVLAGLDDLELAARLVMEGTRTGGNRSPFHGFTTEFHQHRPYRAGDDLKHLDWKLYARSDRLYTRQFRETTNLAVTLVLDTSASMAFPESGVSKWRYAQIIAASLAYLVVEQGNAVGLSTVTSRGLTHLPARGGRPHLLALLAQIDRLVPDGTFDGARAVANVSRLLRRRGVVMLLSDLYDDDTGVQRELRHLAQQGHDVSLLQLTSPEEEALTLGGHIELEDMESGVRRLTDVRAVAASYATAHAAFRKRCRAEAVRAGIDYALLSTATPPALALRSFLRQRGRPSAAAQAHPHPAP